MRRGFFSYLIATILIAFGTILILENIGVAQLNVKQTWLYIYPFIFVALGIHFIIKRIRYRGGSWFLGTFFLLFGALLILDRFHVIDFVFWDVFKLWPLLIVYFGFLFLRHSWVGNKPILTVDYEKDVNDIIDSVITDTVFEDKAGHSDKKYKTWKDKGSFFAVGNHEFTDKNWKVEPMVLKSMAGDFYFDFSKAFIPEKKIPIAINALAGDVHILIPENVDFRMDASVKAGDIDIVGQRAEGINRSLAFETANFSSAVKKLDFIINLKAGSVRVDYV